MVDVRHESGASKAQFFGNIYEGQVVFKYDGKEQKFDMKCSKPSLASLMIFTDGTIFHFGILFENSTFEMKLNGEMICPKGSRPYLFLENNPGGGATFFLTDKKGKEDRE